MEAPQIKAYGFLATQEFIEKNYDEAARNRIFGALSPEIRSFMTTAKKSHFIPPAYQSALWGGIVKEHPNGDEAQRQLVKTGRHMGAFATNTYLRLLMRMLTMKMFANKFPTLWARDANFGKVTVGDLGEIERGRLRVHFQELGSFPYFGPITEGWFSFSLEAMGLKNLKVSLEDWSMQDPDPGELRYRIEWSP